jgi:hypothetical protein
MHAWRFVSRSALAGSIVLLLSAVSCGSSDKTCAEACNVLFDCAAKLDVAPKDFMGSNYATVDSCINRCNTGSCEKKQQLLNCSADLQCTNVSQVQSDVTACFVKSDCSP